MYGLEAIAARNGWAMAFLGFMIVLTGLIVLALVISQLHKVLALWENRHTIFGNHPPESPVENPSSLPAIPIPDRLPDDIHLAASLFQPLVDKLEQPFQLSRLYELSQQMGFPHPHLTISGMRQANILVPQGDGSFTWNLK